MHTRLYCDETMPDLPCADYLQGSYTTPANRRSFCSTPPQAPPDESIEKSIPPIYLDAEALAARIQALRTLLTCDDDLCHFKHAVNLFIFYSHGFFVLHSEIAVVIINHAKFIMLKLVQKKFEASHDEFELVAATCFMIAFKIHGCGLDDKFQCKELAKGVNHVYFRQDRLDDMRVVDMCCKSKIVSMETRILNQLNFSLGTLAFLNSQNPKS